MSYPDTGYLNDTSAMHQISKFTSLFLSSCEERQTPTSVLTMTSEAALTFGTTFQKITDQLDHAAFSFGGSK